jgi:two-component system, OmpR family, sensor kinase
VLVVLVAGAWLVRLSLRPLDRIAGTATAIAGGDLGQRVEPATTRTEVGRLGLALNAMLAQIERAFGVREASEERMRRFLADASHELRTPLTTIRGYAEAFRLGATDDPEELARAMRRIESESARMGVLVEDLLQLARLDAVRDTPGVAVDLTSAARDAVDDAAAVAPDRDIRLRSDVPVTVVADPDQLHQVASNLLRNAIAHTPPGTAIDVAVERRDGMGVLVVRDHGPGLPPGAAEHVFDRFWQGDPARTRAGAGLGLAIIDAIVRAHGGWATAGDAVGGGARFEVTFPEAGKSA